MLGGGTDLHIRHHSGPLWALNRTRVGIREMADFSCRTGGTYDRNYVVELRADIWLVVTEQELAGC